MKHELKRKCERSKGETKRSRFSVRSERGGGQRVITLLLVERARLAPVVGESCVGFWPPRSGRSRLRVGAGVVGGRI